MSARGPYLRGDRAQEEQVLPRCIQARLELLAAVAVVQPVSPCLAHLDDLQVTGMSGANISDEGAGEAGREKAKQQLMERVLDETTSSTSKRQAGDIR